MRSHVTELPPVVLGALFAWCLCHSSVSACNNYQGTPHPRGFCGASLARLHTNVCRVIRVLYPQYFNQTSSAATVSKRAYPDMRQGLLGRLSSEREAAEEQLISELVDRAVRRRGLELKHLLSGYDRPDDSQIQRERAQAEWQLLKDLNLAAFGEGGADFGKRETIFSDKSLLGEVIRRRAGSIGRKRREAGDHSGSRVLSRRKRDLVCDCCYNSCTLETVALYC